MSYYFYEKEPITLNIYKPYSIFPISLVFNTKPERYTYDALTEVEGYFAPRKDFELFVKQNPKIVFDLVQRIYRGLEGFFMLNEVLLLGDAYLRTLAHLIIYSKRFGENRDNKVTFDWNLTHHQLASQTGLARESVTREIKLLQSKGLISYAGKKLVVNNISDLEAEFTSYRKITH